MLEVGDIVEYCPDDCHEKDVGRSGQFAWVFHRKVSAGIRGNQKVTRYEEVPHDEVVEFIKQAKLHPNPRTKLAELEKKQSHVPWRGCVVEAFGDGTYMVDVEAGHPGVTLHYRIKEDESGSVPHTCRKAREA